MIRKLKKSVSLLLTFLLLCGVFTALPLTAYADEADSQRGYVDGVAAAETDWTESGYQASTCPESENTDYAEGWQNGYDQRWSELENEAPGEEYTYEAGYQAGYSAADADYPDNYGGSSCEYPEYTDYADGWQAGYSERWSELAAENPGEEHTYDEGYWAGYNTADADYPDNYGSSSCDYPEYPDYANGWQSGYDQRWSELEAANPGEEHTYDEGWDDGVRAADYDFNDNYGYRYSQPDSAYDAYDDYILGWYDGYEFEWAENTFFSTDMTFYTENGAIYTFNPGTHELTFVSGAFYGDFFEKEFGAGFTSSFAVSAINSVNPAEVPELSEQNLPGVRFEGDCSSMFSNAHIKDHCMRIDLSNVDTSAVTNMSMMFSDTGYKLDILNLANFDTSRVQHFTGMFYNCGADFIDISTFSLDSVVHDFSNPMQDGTFGMFAFADNLDMFIAPADFAVTQEMMLYTPLGGWILFDGDGTKISADETVDLSAMGMGDYDVSTIPAYDAGSKKPVSYYEGLEQQAAFHTNYVIGHSLTLNGDIGVNFFCEVNPEVYWNGFEEFCVLTFEWEGNTYVHQMSHDDFYRMGDSGSAIYKITVNVAAAEMASNIHATCSFLGYTFGSYASDDYSVREYGEYIINAPDGTFEKQDQLVALAKEMLNYGAKAQQVFGVRTDDLANKNVEGYVMADATVEMIDEAIAAANPGLEKSDMTAGTSAFGLNYYGSSVVYLYATSMRHYYTIADQAAYDSAKGEASFSYNESKLPFVYFELRGISASRLDSFQTFTIGGQQYYYSVLDYAKALLTSDRSDADTKALAMATYWYNNAANHYFDR